MNKSHARVLFVLVLTVLTISISSLVSGEVLINEFLAAPVSSTNEWIELYNNGSSSVNLENWNISDSSTNNTLNFTISANSFVLLSRSFDILNQTNPDINSTGLVYPYATNFVLNNNVGDNISLYNSSGEKVDNVSYSSTSTDVSIGRYPNSSSFTSLSTLSPLAQNDNQAPTLTSWTNPSINNSNVSSSVNITLTLSDDTTAISSSVIEINGTNNTLEGDGGTFHFVWSTSPYSDGNYNLTVYFNDSFGQSSSDTLLDTTVDNTQPNITFVSPSSTVNKSGILNITITAIDATTGIKNVTLMNGTSGSNLTLSLSEGTINKGNWSTTINTTAFSDGVTNFSITSYDFNGNVNGSEFVTVTIDNTNPNASFVSPLNNTNVSGNLNITITSLDGTTGTQTVTVQNGTSGSYLTSSFLEGTNNSGNYTLTLDTTALSDGATNLTINTTDFVGNFNNSEYVTITIDNTAPNVTLVSPTNNTNATGTINITITTNDGTTGVNFVSLKNGTNGVTLSSLSFLEGSTSSGNWTSQLDTTTLTDGNYTFTINSTDYVENSNTEFFITLTVDNGGPSISTNSPSSGDNLSGTKRVNVTVTDAVTAVDTVTYRLVNGTEILLNISTSQAGNDYNATLDTTTYADGYYNITVVANDTEGNSNEANISVQIDNTAPAASSENPGNHTFTNDLSNINVSLVINDTTSKVNESSIAFTINLVELSPTTVSSSQNGVVTSFLLVGPYSNGQNFSVQVDSKDNVGNSMATYSWSFAIDTNIPSVNSITTNDSDNNVSGTTMLNITVNATNGASGIVSVNASNSSNIALSQLSTDLWSVTTNVSELGCSLNGNCTVRVTALDNAGNVNSSEYITLDVESISPSVFDLADNDADNKLRSTDSIQINLTVNDTNFGSGTVTIGNGTQVSMGLQSSGNDSYQYSLTTNGSALGCTNSDGTCTLRITATDIVNNINNSEIINLTIDDVAPNTTSISINETGTVRNITMLNVTVNVTDTNTITNVSLNGTALENLTGGVWGTVNPTSELCSGIIDSTCTLGVTAYDELGNLNNTQLLTITISSFSPSVSSLPDITISEDGHNATVNLSNYVTDLDTALGDITWTVFGNSSVQLDINQTTKILNVSAAQDFNGSESITFTASDGTNTDTDTLVVTVTPVNDAPTIPSLSSPINNSNISTTYANLTWSASTDVESDNITYHVFFSNTTSLGFNQSTTSTNVVLNNLTKGTTYYWMIIAGDGSLNGSNSSTYQFTAVNNRAPVLNASVPNVTLTEETADTSIDLDNYFSDEDNDALTFSSTTPSNIAVSISSGVVTLTPSSNFVGTNTITFTANDGTDNTTSNEVTLTVANTNDAPTIDSFSPTSDTTIATQLGSQSFSISFSDVDAGDTPTAAWYRNGTSIAPSNSSNVTVTDLSSGVYNITALVTDNASSTARNEWTLTVNGSITSSELTSPVLSLNESERQSVTSVAINQTTSGGIDFGASTLNFSGVSNLEDAINVSNGLISVNTDTYPGLNKSASLVMKNLNYTKAPLIYTASGFESTSSGTLCSSTVCTGVTYDDSTGKLNFDVAHFTTFYTQTNTTNGAPVITTTAPTGAVEDEAFSYNVDATDPDGDTLTYSLTSSPSGMSISSSSGSISYTPSSIGNFSVTLQVSDGSLTDIQSFNVSVGEAPKLRITDLDVRVDNQKDSNLDNNTKISKEAEPGSEIKFEMDIESFFTNEDDIEINNIEVEITIEDIDDGDNLEEEADDFDLDQGDSDDVKIEFEVPYDVEEGTYDVIILVEGEDDNSTMHYIRWELELEVEKENHQVEVLRASTTPDTVQCQRTISVNAEIVNTGSSDEEEVTLEILSSELGINDITQDIELDEGTDDNRYTKLVTATIPEDVAPGTYPIIMNSYYDNKLSGTGTAYLAVQGCERIKTVKKELTADKKVEITFPKTVVDEAPEKEIEISPQGVISQSTLIAILLVIFLGTVIFIGGAAFILLKK